MSTEMHEPFLQQTIDLAKRNVQTGNGGPFAAIICQNQQIISTCTNTVTTRNDPTAHAEILAIRAACVQLNAFQLSGCILYSSCEYCPMCFGAIYWVCMLLVYFVCILLDAAHACNDVRLIYD